MGKDRAWPSPEMTRCVVTMKTAASPPVIVKVLYSLRRRLGMLLPGAFGPGGLQTGLARRRAVPGSGLSARSVGALAVVLLGQLALRVPAATFCVDVNSTNSVWPYADWSTAATNIQDAVDAATDGDTVLVTNGVYATGGRVMAGDLTNRVALTHALTVQSVNGPGVTTIQGAYTPSTGVGASSLRCAWLTNGASLYGFTLLSGATRNSGVTTTVQSGGGVWCASGNALIGNCILISNQATYYGGGAYQGTFSNCLFLTNLTGQSGGGAYNANLVCCQIISNTADNGGGAYGGTLRSCFVTGNLAPSGGNGGGAAEATLYNCTVTRNSGINGGGVAGCHLTNCIVYSNTGNPYTNYTSSPFAYSCSWPLPSGPGNLALDPQLLGDGIHLANNSPCRGTGTYSAVSGTDIAGQAWANPPSMGCEEWQPAPVVADPPLILISPSGGGFAVNVRAAGSEPFVCWWSRNGVPLEDGAPYSSTQTTNLACSALGELVGGAYQVVVSNAFGLATSAVVQAVAHCVSSAGTNPVAPYSIWPTAATSIQDAITAAGAGDFVLVTNGVYATGGKSMDGIITNRVTVDKALTVLSVNGPGATVIGGNWGTNSPSAVRCAWLTNGAVLSGFTLCGGATRVYTGSGQTGSGGGIWASSTSALVCNCMILTNLASYEGGGAYQASLYGCTLAGNRASSTAYTTSGGGAYSCNLTNCVITGNTSDYGDGGGAGRCGLRNCALTLNWADQSGGGASGGTLVNCTVFGNTSRGFSGSAGAVANATLTNCIVWGNIIPWNNSTVTNYSSCTLTYCDSDPLPVGTGNIDADPHFLPDGFHIAASSPCRGAGTTVAVGADIDGQAWANPPAIGCDEWQPAPAVAGQPQFQVIPGNRSLSFFGGAIGQPPFTWFWIKDGTVIQDSAHYAGSGTSNLVVNLFDVPDAGSYVFVVSNAFGVATSQPVQVSIHCVDVAGTNPIAPYASWAVAATNIQDAITAAGPGEIVLVNDGVYATGGELMYSDVTNRVALDRAVTVLSMNGYASTIIQGASGVPANGPAAIRCAWLTNNATLAGFTLQGGATKAYPTGSYGTPSFAAGAVYCAASSAVVANCLIQNNTASSVAGAIYQGTIVNCAIIGNTLACQGSQPGGIIYSASLNNCTVMGNSLPVGVLGSFCGGPCLGTAKNSIIYANGGWQYPNYYYLTATNCDLSPALSGAGNISSDPQFVDALHIATTSPCRGAGSATYATGADIDGEAWSNPPSMGCDEPLAAGLVGPLEVSVRLTSVSPYVDHPVTLSGQITGRAAWLAWDFGDGTTATNAGYFTSHTWSAPGVYSVKLTAYNTDNPAGVSCAEPLKVLAIAQPPLAAVSWTTNGFQAQFPAQSNLTYTLQWATNLAPPVTWVYAQLVSTNADGVLQITDPAVTNGARFYRLLTQ